MEKETVYDILSASMRAPSGDNSQNWKVGLMANGEGFKLGLDSKVKDSFDVDNIASYISCGCLLKNVEVTASGHGYGTNVEVDLNGGGLNVANVFFEKGSEASPLCDAVGKRATCRGLYDKKEVSEEFYKDVSDFSEKYSGLENIFVKKGGDSFGKCSTVLYETEKIRMFNSYFTEILSKSIRYPLKGDPEPEDGLDYRLLGVPVFQKQVAKMAFNQKLLGFFKKTGLNFAPYLSAKRVLDSSSGLGFVFKEDASSESAVDSGMFFQELWLTLTKHAATLHPFATLPLIGFRVDRGYLDGMSEEDVKGIRGLKEDVFSVLGVDESKELMMVYRYGFPKEKPPFLSQRKGLSSLLSED